MQSFFPVEGSGQTVGTAQVMRLLEQVGDHYRANVANSYIRPALLQLPLEAQDWAQIETLTHRRAQNMGFDLDDLYRQISAAARFVYMVRRDLLPVLRNRLKGEELESRKVFQNMAINNFGSNLRVFADLLNELYQALAELDKQNSRGRKPLYLRMPELLDLGRMLVG
ncbi:MAG: hypothetical protein LBF95_07275 [Treponema sp.]|jgi:hypothetical protein|nr:hypothetical protein [Treponema sp.]